MKTKFLIVIILLTMGALLPMETTSFAFSSAALFTNDEKPTVLSQNLVERQIGGGQSHQYSIELLADQFTYIDVQQLGVDVTVSLFDSEGKLLIETNAPDLSYGAEPFYWVAEKTGNHKIVIKPAETGTKPGKYTITLVELRTVKDDDFHFLDGHTTLKVIEQKERKGENRKLKRWAKCYYQ